MKESYKIINNKEWLEEFVSLLPDLNKDERFYLCLFSRSKYDSSGVLSAGQSQLKRIVCKKEHIISRIRQLECKIGSFTHEGVEVPIESLALYIHANPRCVKKAMKINLQKLIDIVINESHGYNTQTIALNAIQKSSIKKKKWLHFDIDDNDFDLNSLKDILNQECYKVLKTRGGYHVLVETSLVSNQYKKTFYKKLEKFSDLTGDFLIPVPGCIQGGFIPNFIK